MKKNFNFIEKTFAYIKPYAVTWGSRFISSFKNTVNPILKKYRQSIFVGIFLALILFISLEKPDTEFLVSVETEYIWLDSVSSDSDNLFLDEASILDVNYDTLQSNFFGYFVPRQGVSIEFERISNADLTIKIHGNKIRDTVGYLIDYMNDDKMLYIKSGSSIGVSNIKGILNRGGSIVFPFSCKVAIGKRVDRTAGGELMPLIRSGTIAVVANSILHGNRYKEAEELLHTGAFVEFEGLNKANGFISFSEGPAMQASFQIFSSKAYIGSATTGVSEEGYVLRSSLHSRISNDKWYQLVTSIGALIILSMGIFRFTQELKGKKT